MSSLFASAPGATGAPAPGTPAAPAPGTPGAPAPGIPSGDPGGPAETGTTAAPRAARRRVLLWGGIVALVVVVAAIMLWRSPGAPTDAPLDPRNPLTNGAQALAEVLSQQGVSVDVARGQAALDAADVDAGTTVFVPVTDELAEATIDHLAATSESAIRIVLVDPDSRVLRYLTPEAELTQSRRDANDLVARCSPGQTTGFADVRDGERLSHSQSAFRVRADGGVTPAGSCWTDDEGWSAYLSLPATGDHPPVVLFGSRTAVSNDEIDEEADAAVVLRMLGHTSRVVWYVPSFDDIPTDDTSRSDALLPPYLGPSVILLFVAVAGVMLWRGRRLGRLVREPLPVVVRAAETTESRGRLYRRARDSGRAGQVLQEATRRRLAGYLGLPPAGPVDPLVHATAAATGLPTPEVGFLLAGPPPATDDDLLGLAVRLAALEKEVRRS